MEGVLNINKPSGVTSHDVVARVRKILGVRRIGHTGTLDPIATGVLVLCIGKATRIARYLESSEKEYEAVMRLGMITDTQDSTGRVLERRHYIPPSRDEIERTIFRFIGEVSQRPPVFSALKVSGVPSYRLAREGRAMPLAPRNVFIREIRLAYYEDPYVGISIRCSKGVYIRTLCADIGEALGTGAHLTGLVRTRSGRFGLERALTLDELSFMAKSGCIGSALVTMDDALSDMPSVRLDRAMDRRLRLGNKIALEADDIDARLVRVHDVSGRLIAIGRIESGMLRPETVFLRPDE